jgi:DnaJ-class molecular chaperone
LSTTVHVDCLTAITGGEVQVEGIDGSKFVVNLPQATQPNTVLRIKDQGIWQIHGSTRGHLYVKIALTVPRNLTAEQLDTISQIKSTL